MSTWQQERRADKAAAAEQRRADQDAAAQRRRADAEAAARLRRENQAARKRLRTEATAARAAQRAARRAALAGWVRANVLDLMFVPVIVIPAVLAWPAMAAYGREVFGGWGVLLPGFTEGCMWVFAFAVAMAARAERPTFWLQAGVWVSAAMAAAMNYAHGAQQSPAHGVVMALVSVGGVIVHQLVAARPPRPRRTRAERDAARVAARARRRVLTVRLAAVRDAAAQVTATGDATLVFRPRTVRAARRFGRVRLLDTAVPGLPVAALPEVDPAADALAAEIGEYLSALPAPPAGGNGGNTPGTAHTPTPLPTLTDRAAQRVPGLVARARAAIDAGKLPPRPTRVQVQKLLRCRAEVAIVVTHILTDDRGDTTGQGVPA
ncbi:hypothetical protein [Actinokineospora fastidiosa]|uniref:DUF2637 domain-containing protein n=1 Tax=Actinokineospora fastidiosa TaxID=1816 RepID=A0A918GTW5_9PSEU|nr:hypothetical protein [Actinokineospora fastidiosa]GGS61399.1 hypothetical protein GCM10010171_65260 [Actinokineospora fastidiosa]